MDCIINCNKIWFEIYFIIDVIKMFICKICGKSFNNERSFFGHIISHKITVLNYHLKYENFTIPKCKFCEQNAKYSRGLRFFKTCDNKECKIKVKSNKHSLESKRKISKSMKIAHKEGRANNWQDSKKFIVHLILSSFLLT